jgi:fatty-acid peroxygenase
MRATTLPLSDRSARLVRHGYLFTASLEPAERRSLYDDGAVLTRLMGASTLIVSGAAGVALFYDDRLMERHRAVPAPVGLSLFGPGAVHSLDGEAHLHRKQLFRRALSQPEVERLVGIAERRWRGELDRWRRAGSGEVYATAVEVFGASIIEWAGIDEPEQVARLHARLLAEIVDGFGVPGPAFVRAASARLRADRWARRLIRQQRLDGQAAPESWLGRAAAYCDVDGRPLPEKVAAVELLNVLRPTVAVSWLASFAAIALVEHPEWRDRIAADEPAAAQAFAHEVRRYYPFVPVLAARARTDVHFAGYHLPAGHRVLLDVWGTDHGPDWTEPWAFEPGRFLAADPYRIPHFVPQGGGPVDTGHRCPGESVANGLLAMVVRLLAAEPGLSLPQQDRGFSMRRMPTRPASGTVVSLTGSG